MLPLEGSEPNRHLGREPHGTTRNGGAPTPDTPDRELVLDRSGEYPAIRSPEDADTLKRAQLRERSAEVEARLLSEIHTEIPDFELTRADRYAIAHTYLLLSAVDRREADGAQASSDGSHLATASDDLAPPFSELSGHKTPEEERAELGTIIAIATENLIYIQAGRTPPRGLGQIFGGRFNTWPRIAGEDPFSPLTTPTRVKGSGIEATEPDPFEIRRHELGLSLYLIGVVLGAAVRYPQLLPKVGEGLLEARRSLGRDGSELLIGAAANSFLMRDLFAYLASNPSHTSEVRDLLRVIGIQKPHHLDAIMRGLIEGANEIRAERESTPQSPLSLGGIASRAVRGIKGVVHFLEKLG